MIEADVFAVYLAAVAAVYLTPGPDMALIMAVSAGNGARAGFCCAGGIAVARFAHVMVSGLGLAALLSEQPALLLAVRGAGAAYLLWLAWKLWRAKPGAAEQAREELSPWGAVARGFLTNLLNPKALMFCAMLLPQFVSPERGPLLVQFVWLGAVLVAAGCLFDAGYVLAASGLARRVNVSGRLSRVRNKVMGSVFVALAARLAAG
ncbi:LysE family translocator [Fundidesulfovibrio putealis]|uniref:LysE family translocator n=1 Tax=Fundidesulfovibrio putealis TaxID=270496 RepID=UPI000406E748|nr:LysE family translocator [Fundidesulfovibrio putealis]